MKRFGLVVALVVFGCSLVIDRYLTADVIHGATLESEIDLHLRAERGQQGEQQFDARAQCLQEVEYKQDESLQYRRLEFSSSDPCTGRLMLEGRVLVSFGIRASTTVTDAIEIFLDDGGDDEAFGLLRKLGDSYVLDILCGFGAESVNGIDTTAFKAATGQACEIEVENLSYSAIRRR